VVVEQVRSRHPEGDLLPFIGGEYVRDSTGGEEAADD
jgi:hypothetical protein